jgi:hypothetical protein
MRIQKVKDPPGISGLAVTRSGLSARRKNLLHAVINRPISFDLTVKAADMRLYFFQLDFSSGGGGSASGDDLGGSKPDAEPL